MVAPDSRLNWLVFLALGGMWGSSYVFIKIGLEDMAPLTLIAIRLGIGVAFLGAVWALFRVPLPRDRRTYGHILLLAVVSTVIPFGLITWAEQSVDSNLGAIINASQPLFVIAIAAAVLHDEPITANRLAGLAVGFAGVVVMTARNISDRGGDILGEVALVASTVSYAIAIVYARRYVRGVSPIVIAFVQAGFAFVITTVLALAIDGTTGVTLTGSAVVSLLWLGVAGSGLAFLAWYHLITTWGATRTSIVSYLLPVVGIALGVTILSEAVGPRSLVGTALIVTGIALVNSRYGSRRLFGRSPRTAP